MSINVCCKVMKMEKWKNGKVEKWICPVLSAQS